jgi:transcriptional regulator with XRE-family HTH domain
MKQLRQYVREKIETNPDFAEHLQQARAEVRLAVAVAQLRERRGMTQRELARVTGIEQPQIARLEKGEQLPTLDTLGRLLSALGGRFEMGPDGMLNLYPIAQRVRESRRAHARQRKSPSLVGAR